jgi:hypothetical protein
MRRFVTYAHPADSTSVFEAQRPRLMGLNYRMLGTVTAANPRKLGALDLSS